MVLEICRCSTASTDTVLRRNAFVALLGCSIVSIAIWIGLVVIPQCRSSTRYWKRAPRSASDDSLNRKVALVQAERVQQLSVVFLDNAAMLCPPFVGVVSFAVCLNRLLSDFSMGQAALLPLISVALGTVVGLMVVQAFKHRCGHNIVQWCIVVAFSAPLISLFIVETDILFAIILNSVHISQFVMSIIISDRRMFLASTMVSAGLQLFLIWYTHSLTFRMGFTANTVLSTSSLFVLHLVLESNMLTEARALVEGRMATRMEATIEKFMAVMCDAVLTLNANFTFREPCPRLMSLLMRSSFPRGNEMPSFLEYLSAPDVPRFLEFLAAQDDLQVRSIHVHLLDSVGTPVRVQLFHTVVTDLEDMTNHVLGVVEDVEDFDQFQAMPKEGPSFLATTRSPSADQDDTRSAVISNDSFSSVGGISSWGDIGKARVTIRSKVDFELLEESQPSRSLFGFAQEVQNTDNFFARFRNSWNVVRWLEFIHTIAARGVVEHERMHFGEVQFRNQSSGVEYRADLRAVVKRGLQEPRAVPSGQERFDFNKDMRTVDIELLFQPKTEGISRRLSKSPRTGAGSSTGRETPRPDHRFSDLEVGKHSL